LLTPSPTRCFAQEDYIDAVHTPVTEMKVMRAALGSLEENHNITLEELQQAGFWMPPPRVDEEDRCQLFRDVLHAIVRGSPSMLEKYMRDPISQAHAVRQGVACKWWSIACVNAGVSSDGRQQWVVTVVDSTEKSARRGATEIRDHPWHNQLVDAADFVQTYGQPVFRPSVDNVKAALFRAIFIPHLESGAPRRPERLLIPWDMGTYFAELRELGDTLGIEMLIAPPDMSLPAQDEQHTGVTEQHICVIVPAGTP
jgi:hypothetical protein